MALPGGTMSEGRGGGVFFKAAARAGEWNEKCMGKREKGNARHPIYSSVAPCHRPIFATYIRRWRSFIDEYMVPVKVKSDGPNMGRSNQMAHIWGRSNRTWHHWWIYGVQGCYYFFIRRCLAQTDEYDFIFVGSETDEYNFNIFVGTDELKNRWMNDIFL
jgi:hypothetical protein